MKKLLKAFERAGCLRAARELHRLGYFEEAERLIKQAKNLG